MSKKRTFHESSNDEQTNEDSDSVFQQDAKRAKLTLLSDTMLQDLPMELIECILVKTVAMEVEGMHLARNVWKEKANLVISRLSTVCPQWSNILTTNFFRNELHRTLDGIAQKTIRLEILHQSPLLCHVSKMATMKDEIFMLCEPRNLVFTVRVYDRNNLAEVKDVIPLPEIQPDFMEACNVSNCLYILCRRRCVDTRILRITKDAEHQFNITPLITDVWLPNLWLTLSIADNGSVIFFPRRYLQKDPVISIYSANGFIQHQLTVHSGIPRISDIIPKSNGNLVFLSCSDEMNNTLTEIDMDVKIIRQYRSPSNVRMFGWASHADPYGRMLLRDRYHGIELLDSEFNLLEFSGPQLKAGKFIYNSERNEVVTIANDKDFGHGDLTIFRFTEE